MSSKSRVELQIGEFQRGLEELQRKADKDQYKFITMVCAEVERTAKSLMRDTVVNPSVSYGSKGHHPSMPGYAPAPDTGTLLQSVTHSVSVDDDGNVTGYVGSTLKNPDYPRYLEFGTSKMKPRPWLSTAIINTRSWVANLAKEIFKN